MTCIKHLITFVRTKTLRKATGQSNKKQNYTHRRDNAIRNMCIGGGVTLISLYGGLELIAVAGIVVFGIGISDYLICRNHRDDEN